jgi:uncharacterized protein (TIGR03437 family)
MRTKLAFLASLAAVLAAPLVTADNLPSKQIIATTYLHLPLRFEPLSRAGEFQASGNRMVVWLSADSVRLGAIRMRLAGAQHHAAFAGLDLLTSHSNYFVGSEPRGWRTNVPNYGKVKFSGVYPGIDLVYHGDAGHLEYDFVLASHANPQLPQLTFGRAASVTVDDQGGLLIQGRDHARDQTLRFKKPVAYQEGQEVEVRYKLMAHGRIGFSLGRYDAAKPVTIDPTLVFATYLGGDFATANGVAVDSSGNIYLAGDACCGFPVKNALQSSTGSGFIAKFNPSGSSLIYATYFGGSVADSIQALIVDGAGNVYVTGATSSPDFPVVNPLQSSLKGPGNAFLAKLNVAGTALLYSTFLGGSGGDMGYGLQVDAAGNAYVAGITSSTDFPLVNPIKTALTDSSDAFVAKLNPSGSALLFSTYLGGSAADQAHALALDSSGNIYVTGSTCSSDFPVLKPLQQPGSTVCNAFVTKFNSAFTLAYSTMLGGNGVTAGNSIAIDPAGSAYITGSTRATDFPTVKPFQASAGNVFVAKLAPDGSSFVYSTFLGTPGQGDAGYAIAVDSAGEAYVAGAAHANFPVVNALQPLLAAGLPDPYAYEPIQNAFISKFSADGSRLLYSTYLGGGFDDGAGAIALDGSGQAYVAGFAASNDFPAFNAFQVENPGHSCCPMTGVQPGGQTNAFLAKIADASPTNCQFLINATTLSLPGSGSTDSGATDGGKIKVLANSDVCNWQAASSAPWLTLTGANQSGIGNLPYVATPNPGFAPRSATITVGNPASPTANQSVTVTQNVQSYLSATAASGVPGSIARVTVAVVTPPTAATSLTATFTVVPNASAPAITAALSFQPDPGTPTYPVPSPAIAVSNSPSGSTITLTWQQEFLIGQTYFMGEILVPIPSTAATGQSYSVQGTGGNWVDYEFQPSTFIPGMIATISVGNPSPASKWLSPVSAATGGAGFTLTVNGEGFAPASTVLWNGSPRATTFTSETQLQAAITAADLTAAGTAQVAVSNPAPNGGQSNVLSFLISGATPPSIPTSQSVVGAASYSGNLSGGMIASVFGSNFASSVAFAGSIPLPTLLNGVSVRVDGVLAPLFYVSPGQINFQLPVATLNETQARIEVINNGVGSAAQIIPVMAAAPAIFTTNSSGTGQGVAVDGFSYNLIAPVNSVPGYICQLGIVGEPVIIYTTGFGALSGSGHTVLPAQVTVGGLPAMVLYSGVEPNFVGLTRVDVVIPAGVASGPAIPVVVTMNGVVSNTVTIAIQ